MPWSYEREPHHAWNVHTVECKNAIRCWSTCNCLFAFIFSFLWRKYRPPLPKLLLSTSSHHQGVGCNVHHSKHATNLYTVASIALPTTFLSLLLGAKRRFKAQAFAPVFFTHFVKQKLYVDRAICRSLGVYARLYWGPVLNWYKKFKLFDDLNIIWPYRCRNL